MKLVNTSLNKLIQDKNLTFLIGAGCSVNTPSCLPTGNEMMEDIIEFSYYKRFKEDVKNLIDENEFSSKIKDIKLSNKIEKAIEILSLSILKNVSK